MKVAAIGARARGCAGRGSPRSEAPEFRMTTENESPKPWLLGRVVVMRTSMSMPSAQYDLSALSRSRSEALDNFRDLQYGLELVIPMLSRRLENR